MLDRYERDITYLRISVTNRCNLRCTYCVPEDYVNTGSDDMEFYEIVRVAEAAVSLGIRKIRLTGGEPLVRRGITELVSMLKSVRGIDHLAMTTNGVLLDRFAGPLKEAGLDSINISLDTLNAERYRKLTRTGDLHRVLKGIRAIEKEGFSAVKINMVVMDDTADEEIEKMQDFCSGRGFTLQLINHYELSGEKRENYRFDRPPKCELCNRIRLTADGYLKPCLHSNREIPLNRNDLVASLRKTILSKPARGRACTNRSMIEIGG